MILFEVWKRIVPALLLLLPVQAASASGVIFPAPQSWQREPGVWNAAETTRIVIAGDAAEPVAESLRDDLERLTQRRVAVARGAAGAGDILLESAPDAAPEGYRLEIRAGGVRIAAPSSAGLFYGAQSLLQLVRTSPRAKVEAATIVDAPAFRMRAAMLDVGRRYWSVERIDAFMRDMAWKKLNILHLHFTDWPAFRLDSPAYPGLAPAGESYGRADIEHLENAAKRYHITIIPEIDLPAHAVPLTRFRPELAFRCESLRRSPWLSKIGADRPEYAWTVDITRQENRDWIDGLLRTFVPWFSGPYFHIGGDEYQHDADLAQCPELVAAAKSRGFAYPGDMFVDWINHANGTVRSMGKQAMIWNWWRFDGDRTAIEPDRDILVQVWSGAREEEILNAGYSVLLSPEDRLYVSPGLVEAGDSYGRVDLAELCCRQAMPPRPGVTGYSVAIWADRAEQHSDDWFLARARQPVAILADRLWTGKPRARLEDATDALRRIGIAPGVTLPDAR